jgi:serine/threonine protein kinase
MLVVSPSSELAIGLGVGLGCLCLIAAAIAVAVWLKKRHSRSPPREIYGGLPDGYELVPPPEKISQRPDADSLYDAAAPADKLVRSGDGDHDAAPHVSTLARSQERYSTANLTAVWRIDSAELEMGRVLGQGAFGVVTRGKWRGRSVAVKQIKKTVIGSDKAVADFEQEIGRMSSLQPHENVVTLYGVATLDNGDLGAVVEFCAQGALVDALYGDKARTWTDEELLEVAYDAACGVMHLHAHKIVHRDIAARNVLLAGKKDLVAKVSDFGMARDMSGVAEQQTTAHIGPLRWMAPEQIARLAYSQASDVFAFGVLLYEIFAREQPWRGVANVNVMNAVSNGERMTPPKSAPAHCAQLMLQCWAHDPKERPAMTRVTQILDTSSSSVTD